MLITTDLFYWAHNGDVTRCIALYHGINRRFTVISTSGVTLCEIPFDIQDRHFWNPREHNLYEDPIEALSTAISQLDAQIAECSKMRDIHNTAIRDHQERLARGASQKPESM